MGLDITAYSNLNKELQRENMDVDEAYEHNWTYFYIHNDQDCYQHIDVDDSYFYSYEYCENMRAGSYGGYNSWRSTLRQLSSQLPIDNNGYYPFYELINYSDCEGVIGTMCSTKLAKDFNDYEEQACLYLEGYNLSKYYEWKKMFELASNNGAVKFH